MPKSKSKRKNKVYRPRTIKVGPYWTPQQQANIEEKLRRVAMFVEVTLPAGTATFWQMDWIEDTLNWFLGMLYKRFKHLDQRELNEVGPLLIDARHAINAIMDRKESGQTSGYIATGDELRTISEAFAVIIPTLKKAVALSPHTCMKEFDWAQNRANEKLRRKQNEKCRNK